MLQPFENVVVVEPDQDPKESKGGIVIPDAARKTGDAPRTGTVKAVGPAIFDDGRFLPVEVRVGDRIVYDVHGTYPLDLVGENLIALRRRDLIAVLK